VNPQAKIGEIKEELMMSSERLKEKRKKRKRTS
jgi:hypothetical protein